MRKMKRFAALVLAGAVLTALTGCQGGGSAAGEKQAEANGKVTLEFYAWLDEEGIFTKLTEEYKKINSNVDFNLHFVPTTDYDTKLLTAFSGGAQIDCFAASGAPVLASYQKKGQLYSIDELVAENNVDVSGFEATYEGLKMDGKAYALPYKSSSWVVYYNKDIFDQAGIAYPPDDWTWEEYEELAAKLTSGEGNDKIYGSLNYQPTNTWWRIPANGKGSTNPLNEEELDDWLEAAAFARKLSDDGYQPSYADRSGEAGADYTGAFMQGKYAMFYNGDWAIEMLNTAAETGEAINYDIAPLPHYEGEEPMTTGTPAVLLIPQNSKHPKEAFDFMAYVSGKRGAEFLAKNDYFPAWSSDEIIDIYTKNIKSPEHVDYILNQKIYPQVPCDPLFNSAASIVKEEVSLYLLGEQQDLKQVKKTILERFKSDLEAE